jgi:AcrR family transcriptional regulator
VLTKLYGNLVNTKLFGNGATMRDVDAGGPVRRHRMSADRRRESILAAAVAVFTTAGYRAGKVSDVAALVGVTEPVVFQNFGSKAALFAAALDRVADDLRAELDVLAGEHGSAAGLLAHLLSGSPAGRPHGSDQRPLFADAVGLTAESQASEPGRRILRMLAGHLADLLRRGQADGDIRADLDAEAGAWLILSVLAARPLRAAMPDRHRLDDGVTALILQMVVQPRPADVPG